MATLSRLLAAAALLVALPAALAQAPREIPYQGTLTDGGAPVTVATAVVFELHDAEAGGSVVWAETQTITPDADGRFAARLGSVTDLISDLDRPLWLSVTAGGTALGPRTPLGAAPYALALYGIRVTPDDSGFGYGPSIAAGLASNVASGRGAVVAGGGSDYAGTARPNTASGIASVVGGGVGNTAAGNQTTVGGGIFNTSNGNSSTVGGGIRNRTVGSYAIVGSGYENEAIGTSSTVSGGSSNVASGFRSTVPGGYRNHARGSSSFAAGSTARAIHNGTFVWSDNSNAIADSLLTTGESQFLIRAAGGVGIGTNAPTAQLHVETGAAEAGLFRNDGGSGLSTATVFAENLSTASGIAGWFETNGTDATLVVDQDGSGDIVRAFSSGNLRFRVRNNGDVRADGSFIGGGADLAEYFPLAPGARVVPGQVVGIRGGRVSLDTRGAEQVAVISSDPAFVGNPDAADGGALVALVGQVEVQVAGAAAPGDLLIASGGADGRARAVAPAGYTLADGAVLGRVLTADGGRVVALVGVDQAAALRGVVARQARQIDALTARLARLEALLAP